MIQPSALSEIVKWADYCDDRIAWPLRRIANPMGVPAGVRIPLVAPILDMSFCIQNRSF